MKAAVLNRINKPLEIENLIQEDPKYGEVKIKVNYAGICASDAHVMYGTATLPRPVVLGHEGSGVVVEIGRWRSRGAGLRFSLRRRPRRPFGEGMSSQAG